MHAPQLNGRFATRTKLQRGNALRMTLAILAGLVLLFLLYLWLMLSWSYSTGERAGYVQKLSHKGWVCKTWEGELSLITLPGQQAEKFYFSIRDEAVVDKINALMGERVSLQYAQHVGLPTDCFGETNYFITDVRKLAVEAGKL